MFFKKKKSNIKLAKDPFPDYNDVNTRIIIDIRGPEDVEFYGKLPNSKNIPFDEYFASKLMMLDKSKKYAIMDDRGILTDLKKAVEIAKNTGLDAVGLRGGFFYITEVLNIKPIKGEE
ncbi:MULTISPECIES: rhodanese-like domain-containing protein [unclassified Lebetimonas]|uniref:rhodanese-like domain-containing protein n=1 Tax=unclassified Lebetimonas TaxID=2648158 RepID=UPI000464425F|nr:MULTISPECIES: rhodanese-like domain-containing protein [unclassified Lebetimonas]